MYAWSESLAALFRLMKLKTSAFRGDACSTQRRAFDYPFPLKSGKLLWEWKIVNNIQDGFAYLAGISIYYSVDSAKSMLGLYNVWQLIFMGSSLAYHPVKRASLLIENRTYFAFLCGAWSNLEGLCIAQRR